MGGGVAEGASLDGAVDLVRDVEELRRDTLAALVEVAGRLGHGDILVNAARELLRLDPFREQAAAALARQLAAMGRQADALEVLREVCLALVDQLGVEPSVLVRDAELAVLRQEVTMAAGGAGPAPGDRLPRHCRRLLGARPTSARSPRRCWSLGW